MLPADKVTAELLAVLPKVNEPMLVAAEATDPPTSRRVIPGVAVNPVALKDVSSTAPVVLIARPFVEVTSKTSARSSTEADEEVTTDPGVWPNLAEAVPPWEILPPARSARTDTEPDPESSWTSVRLISGAAPEVAPRTVTVPAPVAARMTGKPAEGPSWVPTLKLVAPVAEPVKRMSPSTVR